MVHFVGWTQYRNRQFREQKHNKNREKDKKLCEREASSEQKQKETS